MEGKDECGLMEFSERCDFCYSCVRPRCCAHNTERRIFGTVAFLDAHVKVIFCCRECTENWVKRQKHLKTKKIVKPRLSCYDIYQRDDVKKFFDQLDQAE